MTTINIKVNGNLNEGKKYPFFVIDTDERGLIWMVTGPAKNKREYYKATFLGNDNYHPFQYQGEIRLCKYEYKKIERTRVVLQFD